MKVALEREPVTLFTSHHCIEGDLHLPSTGRVSDRLNASKDFLPITSARVYALDGRLQYETEVVLVHKAHIVMILERDADL